MEGAFHPLNNWGQVPQEVERKSTRRSVLCTLQTNFLIGERNQRWCNASHNPNPDNKRSSISKGPLKIGGWKSYGITQKHQKETLGSSNKGVWKWLTGGSRTFPFVFYEIVVVFAQVSSNLSEWHLCPKMQLILGFQSRDEATMLVYKTMAKFRFSFA